MNAWKLVTPIWLLLKLIGRYPTASNPSLYILCNYVKILKIIALNDVIIASNSKSKKDNVFLSTLNNVFVVGRLSRSATASHIQQKLLMATAIYCLSLELFIVHCLKIGLDLDNRSLCWLIICETGRFPYQR